MKHLICVETVIKLEGLICIGTVIKLEGLICVETVVKVKIGLLRALFTIPFW